MRTKEEIKSQLEEIVGKKIELQKELAEYERAEKAALETQKGSDLKAIRDAIEEFNKKYGTKYALSTIIIKPNDFFRFW